MKKKVKLGRVKIAGAGVRAPAAAPGISKIARADAKTGLSPKSEKTIRKYYAAWEQTAWRPLDVLLADDFTFTSPNGDDHIDKSTFKTRCWKSQLGFIERFDLQRIFGQGNEAVVMYVCRTKNGKTFRNVEHLQLKNDRLVAVECYFGAPSSFASAVSTG